MVSLFLCKGQNHLTATHTHPSPTHSEKLRGVLTELYGAEADPHSSWTRSGATELTWQPGTQGASAGLTVATILMGESGEGVGNAAQFSDRAKRQALAPR